jgi:hypothetical protein
MSEPLREDATAPEASEAPAADDTTGPGPGLPPPTATESLVNALLEAGPEVAEHVVRAAQELLLAAQAIVDAAEHAVHEQQAVRADSRTEPPAPGDDATVHHLDIAE